MKECVKCGRKLPLSFFSKHYKRPDKKQKYCKECESKAYYDKKEQMLVEEEILFVYGDE